VFLGHFGLGFGAKRLAPQVSLGALLLACQLADLVWPDLVLLGIERFSIDPGNTAMTPLAFEHYPYSHSLLALAVWAALLAGIYWAVRKASLRAALVLAGLVLSHWFLDYLTHRPDMPITPFSALKVGLGLWDAPIIAIGLELVLFAGGVWLYDRSTVARDRIGRTGFWALVGFLTVIYVANILGPPPPSTAAVAWSAQAIWLLVAWGYWIDRHRAPRPRGRWVWADAA